MTDLWTPESVPVSNPSIDRGGSDPSPVPYALLPLPDQWPRSVHSEGFVTSLVVVSGPCRLFGFQGYDANASGEFVQVYDKSNGTLPSSGAHPAVVLSTGTSVNNFSAYFGTAGRWMYRGVVIVASSTADTYTAAASANMYIDVQYA